MTDYYDPLTWENLMAGLVAHFERQPRMSLTAVDTVRGPGIYVLFYNGTYSAYAPISGTLKPIYAGKAVPEGARKGTVKKNAGQTALTTLNTDPLLLFRSGLLWLNDFCLITMRRFGIRSLMGLATIRRARIEKLGRQAYGTRCIPVAIGQPSEFALGVKRMFLHS